MQQNGKPANGETDKGDLFLTSLREATGPQHKHLEEHLLSKTLVSPQVSLEEYATYLACMQGVMERYDSEVLPFLRNIIPNNEARKKSSSIEHDLHYLQDIGVTVPPVEKFYMPVLSGIGFAMGVAYVIEGSTLGGRVIIKNLQSRLPVNEKDGALFFAGYGNQTGIFWKQFLESLIAFTLENESQQEVIAGAQACFQSIYNHFDKMKILNEV